MWKLMSRVLGGAVVIAALLLSPATQAAASNAESSLAAVRAATAQFHSIPAAIDAGYADAGLPCFDRPGVGGMGIHYVNGSLVAPTVTPTKPQALVYEIDGGKLQLVAVEYLIPFNSAAVPPRLFGQAFVHAYYKSTPLPFWALHAWIWRPNPLGMFANYNPAVGPCPK